MKRALQKELDEQIRIQTANGEQVVSKLQVILKTVVNDAARGKPWAVSQFSKWAGQAGLFEDAHATDDLGLSADDQRIIADFLKNREDQGGKAPRQ